MPGVGAQALDEIIRAARALADGTHPRGPATRAAVIAFQAAKGLTPNGVVGPPLGGIARRTFIAGQLPNRPEVLVAFLRDPPALVPSTGMPDTGVTREEARQIAAYLYTLEP
mgnify:CR=1 FL=1